MQHEIFRLYFLISKQAVDFKGTKSELLAISQSACPQIERRASLHLRPENTQAALNYHAAQMIAGGITFQTCEVCGTSFFGGGPAREKRARALYCSDKCRWTHHNKVRQKDRQSPGRRLSPAKN